MYVERGSEARARAGGPSTYYGTADKSNVFRCALVHVQRTSLTARRVFSFFVSAARVNENLSSFSRLGLCIYLSSWYEVNGEILAFR